MGRREIPSDIPMSRPPMGRGAAACVLLCVAVVLVRTAGPSVSAPLLSTLALTVLGGLMLAAANTDPVVRATPGVHGWDLHLANGQVIEGAWDRIWDLQFALLCGHRGADAVRRWAWVTPGMAGSRWGAVRRALREHAASPADDDDQRTATA